MNRRNLLKLFGVSAAALLLKPLRVFAEIPASIKDKILDLNSAVAKRIKYVEDATKSTEKKYKAGQQCDGCSHYKTPEGGYGKCPMATNKYVKAEGWCNLFAAKKS